MDKRSIQRSGIMTGVAVNFRRGIVPLKSIIRILAILQNAKEGEFPQRGENQTSLALRMSEFMTCRCSQRCCADFERHVRHFPGRPLK